MSGGYHTGLTEEQARRRELRRAHRMWIEGYAREWKVKLPEREPIEPSMVGNRRVIDEDQLRALVAQGLAVLEIAERIDFPRKSVDRACRRLGLTPVRAGNGGMRACPERDARIAHLYAKGQTYREIAEAVGMTEGGLGSALHRLRTAGKVGKRANG